MELKDFLAHMTDQMGNDKKFLSPNQCMPLGIYESIQIYG